MARTKHTARTPSCPICLDPPGQATIRCIKCKIEFHQVCVNWNHPPPFLCLDCGSKNDYFVKAIVDHRSQNGDRQFLIKWYRGSPTWEPEKNLSNCLDLLKSYITSHGLEPSTIEEPMDGPVGSTRDNIARPSSNWITLLKIKILTEKWTKLWPKASLDLPITILKVDDLDTNKDQLVLVKKSNHCFVALFVVVDERKCVIRIADGNNTFLNDISTRKGVIETISPFLGWSDVEYIPTKSCFGARSDLCGAAAILCALAFKVQYKNRHLTDEIYVPKYYRDRVLLDLRSTPTSHSDGFIPLAGRRCRYCLKRLPSQRSIYFHEKFCNHRHL